MFVGIDFGKKTGIARADQELRIAIAVKTAYSFKEVVESVKELSPKVLVIGWPMLLSGVEGLQCQRVKSMLANLLKEVGEIEYHLQDERFSTRFSGDDARSAAWILQVFLDKNKLNEL